MNPSTAEPKRRKVFQVAQELKLMTPTILEFLETIGCDVTRKQMSPISEEMYVEVLRKFDRGIFQQYQDQHGTTREQVQKRDSERLRQEELNKIIAVKEKFSPTPRKIELPKYHDVVVKPADKEETSAEAAALEAQAADTAAIPAAEEAAAAKHAVLAKEAEAKPEPRRKTRAKKAAEPSAKPPETETKPAETAVEVKAPPTKPEPKKLALDKLPSLQTEKKPTKRLLKRKRIVAKVETPEDAIESEVEARLAREKEKLARQKTAGHQEAVAFSRPSGKRRRRRSRSAAGAAARAADTKKTGRGKHRSPVDEKEVAASIKETFAKVEGRGKGRKKYSHVREGDGEAAKNAKLNVTEFITTQELANLIEIPVQDIIRHALGMGMIISINQRLDHDVIELLTAEFDIEVAFVDEEEIDEEIEEVSTANMIKRSPVVTVMGHVDHGKTTLLDFLRRTHVAEDEVGGITQHIGAYEVDYQGSRITFLDTPGHEAFTAMRAHGAQITDLVILVVAADDRVMSQTIEAYDHARAAGTPIVVAINKIDKPGANADAIYKQLADHNILVEKWGGKYQCAEISAKFGQGVDDLLAEILVAADLLDLKADPMVRAKGVVVESRLDKGLGAVATVLVQTGTLSIGDNFVVGQHYGRVRSLYDERSNPLLKAGPATPVQVVGFHGVPQAGDRLVAQSSEREAREISLRRQRQQREFSMRHIKALSLEQVGSEMNKFGRRELPLIIKGDVHGSVEVLSDVLMKLSNGEVHVEIILRSVGGITESDVLLASASGAVIIGFHVHPNVHARELAKREGVQIRLHRIIHEVVDEIKQSLEGMLAPLREERIVGTVEVRRVFKISRIGTVAGCYVLDGKINRNNRCRMIRDNVGVWSGELSSLKRFKDDVREVQAGFECGIALNGQRDIREGDRIEAYEVVETARKLEAAL